MTVAHPQAGRSALIAERYVHPLAGWLVRYSYWFMQPVAIGGQVTAAAIYMRLMAAGGAARGLGGRFLDGIVYLICGRFGKLGPGSVLVLDYQGRRDGLFMVLGAAVLLGSAFPQGHGEPHRARRVPPERLSRSLDGHDMAIFSFIGSRDCRRRRRGESRPGPNVPRTFRMTGRFLAAIYVVASLLLVTLAPWTSAGLGESPFVTVLRTGRTWARPSSVTRTSSC